MFIYTVLAPRESYEIEFRERQLGLRVDQKSMPLRVIGVTPPAADGTISEGTYVWVLCVCVLWNNPWLLTRRRPT